MSNSNLPHMPLWVYDIDTDRDCRAMRDADFGRYIRLLIRQWIEGSVPSDPVDAIRDACLDHDAVDSVTSLLDRKFKERDGSGRKNHRCMVERDSAIEKVDRLRENGRAGGLAKALAIAKPIAKANAPHIQNQIQNQKKNPPNPPGGVCVSDFDLWWEKYPHRVGKGAARKAYASACKRTDAKTLLDGVAAYIRHKPPDQKWCNPATWLNQDRWEDRPASGGVVKPKTGIAALTDTQRASLAGYAKERESLHGYPDGAQPVVQAMLKHLDAWRERESKSKEASK